MKFYDGFVPLSFHLLVSLPCGKLLLGDPTKRYFIVYLILGMLSTISNSNQSSFFHLVDLGGGSLGWGVASEI